MQGANLTHSVARARPLQRLSGRLDEVRDGAIGTGIEAGQMLGRQVRMIGEWKGLQVTRTSWLSIWR